MKASQIMMVIVIKSQSFGHGLFELRARLRA